MNKSMLVAVSTVLAFAVAASAAELPPDLALVPANAAGFVHIRVAELAKHDDMKELRAFVAKAGPDALKTFSERFAPDPLSLERVTMFLVMPPADGNRPPMPIPSIVFRMAKPFDAAKVQKSFVPNGEAKRVGDASFMSDRSNDMALRFIDDRTFQIGPPREFDKLMALPKVADGPLTAALARAVNTPVFAAFNAAAIPAELRAQIPAAAVPIAKLKFATMAVQWDKTASIDFRLIYPDSDSAADAEQMLHTVIEMGRSALVGARAELEKMLTGDGKPGNLMQLAQATGGLVGLGAIREYEDMLKALPLKRDGAEISLQMDVPTGVRGNLAGLTAVGAASLVPAIVKVREAAGRVQDQNNMKQLALAMFNYNDTYGGKLPAHAIYSKDGKTPLLSWRVAILPYLEQEQLYRQFRLDEPWDSEHNKKLIPLMPRLFVSPQAPPTRDPGMTYYQVFVGGGAPWENSAKPPGIPRTFVDGTSNTILIAEAGDPVIWTKPADMIYDPQKPLPRLGNLWQPRGFNVAFADGSVRFITPKVTEANLRGAITAAGGETIELDP